MEYIASYTKSLMVYTMRGTPAGKAYNCINRLYKVFLGLDSTLNNGYNPLGSVATMMLKAFEEGGACKPELKYILDKLEENKVLERIHKDLTEFALYTHEQRVRYESEKGVIDINHNDGTNLSI